jgi:hypothetical protein
VTSAWTILAAMLFLQSPGQSIYSRTIADKDSGRPCDDDSLLCEEPRWSGAHGAYTVAESYADGLRRYQDIADQLHAVVYDPRAKWTTPKNRLWKEVITVAYHESGFRRDVHSGIGVAARGDCKWTGKGKERRRVPGSCKSHCLAQVMYYAGLRSVNGWKANELTGLDKESTRRCLYVAATYLDRANSFCKQNRIGREACVFSVYGGLGGRKLDKRIRARVNTYNRISAAPALDAETKEALTP